MDIAGRKGQASGKGDSRCLVCNFVRMLMSAVLNKLLLLKYLPGSSGSSPCKALHNDPAFQILSKICISPRIHRDFLDRLISVVD